MPQLRGVIFDLDGTLVDSATDLRQALNQLLTAHGRRLLTLAEIKDMIGDGMYVLLRRAFAATGEPLHDQAEKTVSGDFLRFYQNQQASIEQLYPLVIETITGLRAQKIRIGLCTNKLYKPTLKLLADIGITGLFDCVAGGDSFPVFKPDPGHVLGVVAGLKLLPQNCVMIGDSANDIRAAQAADVKNIAVAHGYGADVASLGADAVIAGFAELPEALRHLGFDLVDRDIFPR